LRPVVPGSMVDMGESLLIGNESTRRECHKGWVSH
jgi:hypothetical protein